ncbi:MAG: hypothetical protein JWO41_20 [Candidatus Saccharibacteria bacterium]|nr:hypothetical protein [Candidatus Saccharibacteria bacterium]
MEYHKDMNFAIYLLGRDTNDHTLLVALYAALVILAMLLLRKFILQVILGKQNKKP